MLNRDEKSQALINNDAESLKSYKQLRQRAKAQKTLEERVLRLEQMVEKLVNNASGK